MTALPQGPAAIIGCCLQSNNIHSVQPCISFKNCFKLVIFVPQINCSLSSWLFPPFCSLLLSSRSDIVVFVLLWGGKRFCLFFLLNTQLLLIRAGGWCWESNLPHLWLDKKQVNTLTLKGTSESPVRLRISRLWDVRESSLLKYGPGGSLYMSQQHSVCMTLCVLCFALRLLYQTHLLYFTFHSCHVITQAIIPACGPAHSCSGSLCYLFHTAAILK